MITQHIYKIFNLFTGCAEKVGITSNAKRRLNQYKREPWWKKDVHQLIVYRTIERHNLTEEDYGVYAAAVEHMEICRNKTWDTQGGRNIISPFLQRLGGPELCREFAYSGGIIGGRRTAAIPGHMAEMGRIGGSATKETTEGRKGNCGKATNETTNGRKRNGGLIGGHISGGSKAGKLRMSSLGKIGSGLHTRWHTNRGIIKEGCELCKVKEQ